ncbi:LytR family transcriptional regulator, partial [Dietzia maris]
MASRIGRVLAALVSAVCLLVTGVGWTLVSGLSSDLSSAGGLDVGDGGLDGAVDILLVGTDNRTDAQGNPLSQEELATIRTGEEDGENTDTILLIRIPEDGSSATAISIPRDVYVETSTVGGSKINGVYAANKEAHLERVVASDPEGVITEEDQRAAVNAGRNGLIGAVADLTGVQADHYAEIGLLGFVLLTDAVGGVPVCLNEPVDEPLSGANFDAGVQTVSGSDALSFVRQRHDLPAGDLDRIVRQQVFMSQLVKKILSAGTLTDPGKLGALVDAAKRSFVIDENWDFVDFAMKLKDI